MDRKWTVITPATSYIPLPPKPRQPSVRRVPDRLKSVPVRPNIVRQPSPATTEKLDTEQGA